MKVARGELNQAHTYKTLLIYGFIDGDFSIKRFYQRSNLPKNGHYNIKFRCKANSVPPPTPASLTMQ